jgi:flagellar biosynthesis protein FlhA
MAVEQPPTPLEDLLEVQVLELQLGCGVARLADESRGGDLMERLSQLRRQVALELGLIVPPVRICDNPQLPASQYVLKIRGAVVARGEAYQDQQLATDAGQALPAITHADSIPDPATGRPSYWITDSQEAEARRLGYALSSAAEAMTSHLQMAIREQAHLLLNREEVRRLVDHLKRTSPALVEEVIGPQIRLGELQKVLQNLLRRGIGIRDLEIILERLGDHAGGPVDIDHLTEHCARALTCHQSQPGTYRAPGQSIVLARR